MSSVRWCMLWQILWRYHFVDYLLCLLFEIIQRCVSVYVTPYCRSFSWDDPSISYPHIKKDDSTWLSLSVIRVIPFVVFIWGELIQPLFVFYFTDCTEESETEYEELSNEQEENNEGEFSIEQNATSMRHNFNSQLHSSINTKLNNSIVITEMIENEDSQGVTSSNILPTEDKSMNVNEKADMRVSQEGKGEGSKSRIICVDDCSSSIIVFSNNSNNNSSSNSNSKNDNIFTTAVSRELLEENTQERKKSGNNNSPALVEVQTNRCSTVHEENVTLEKTFVLARLLSLHYWILTYLLSLTLAVLIKQFMKVYAGRLRPDFLARLRKEGYRRRDRNNTSINWCNAGLKSRVSFPSGHSTTSFATFTVISFYVAHCIRLFRPNRHDALLSPYIKLIIVLLPLVVPTVIAISRTRDYRHNFDDIVAGACIGFTCALFAGFVYFRINTVTGRFISVHVNAHNKP